MADGGDGGDDDDDAPQSFVLAPWEVWPEETDDWARVAAQSLGNNGFVVLRGELFDPELVDNAAHLGIEVHRVSKQL